MKNLHTFEEFLNESYAYDIRRGLKHIKFMLSDPLMYKTPFYISFKKGTNEKEIEALIKDEEKENKSVSKMKRTYGTNPYSHLTLQIENPNYGGLTWIFKAIDKLYGNSGESMGWHGEIQESVNELGPLTGSGNVRANELDNLKREASKKSERGETVYIVGSKNGSYKLSKYFEEGNTYAAFYNGMPQVVETLNETTTLASMFAELGTWITFSPDEKEAAEKSKVTDRNNKRFKDLVKDWSKGMYDEDPQYAAQELRSILGPIKK